MESKVHMLDGKRPLDASDEASEWELTRRMVDCDNLDIDPTTGGLWFRKLAGSLPYLAFELDNRGNVTFANPALMSLSGYEAGEFASGLKAQQLIDSRDMERLQNDILARIAGRQQGTPEYTLISKAGKRIPVEVFASPILGEDKKAFGLRGIAFDITRRKRNEDSLRQNALELDRVFNTAAGAMCIVNKDFTIRRMNNEFAATFGLDELTSTGRKCHELMKNICCERMECPMSMVLGGANRIEQETEADTAAGEKASFHLTVVPYLDSDGEVLGMVSNFRNITDIKLVQRQLQQASLLASLGEMTAGIAHEVNNPLSSILLYSELLMAGDIHPAMRKDLRLIHSEAERATQTMSELLNYARGIETTVRKVNLNTLVKKVLEVRSYQQEVKNVRVARRLSRSPLYILGDANQLTQVIMNIVMNAEDSLGEKKGGDITITTEAGAKWGRLIISDSGKGIAENNLQKIFFPFFTTKKNTQRAGLGLSVCYGIITRHHGFIRAENNPDGGTSFIVELPLVQAKSKSRHISGNLRGEKS